MNPLYSRTSRPLCMYKVLHKRSHLHIVAYTKIFINITINNDNTFTFHSIFIYGLGKY